MRAKLTIGTADVAIQARGWLRLFTQSSMFGNSQETLILLSTAFKDAGFSPFTYIYFSIINTEQPE